MTLTLLPARLDVDAPVRPSVRPSVPPTAPARTEPAPDALPRTPIRRPARQPATPSPERLRPFETPPCFGCRFNQLA